MNRYFLSLVFALFFAVAGFAQQVPVEVHVNEVETLTRDVDSAVDSLDDIRDNDTALIELNRRLSDLSDQLVDKGVVLSEQLTSVRNRLEQLGEPPPPDGLPELEVITEERNALGQERAQLNRLIGLLEAASVQTNQGMTQVEQARRDLFTDTLSRRFDLRSAIGPQLVDDFTHRWSSFFSRVSSWATFNWRTRPDAMLGAMLFSALFGLIGWFLTWRLTKRFVYRDPAIEEPNYFARLTTGFAYAIVPFLGILAMLIFSYGVFEAFGILRPDIALMLATIFGTTLILVLVWRLAEALFSPSKPNWRIMNVANRAARPLKVLMILMAVVIMFDILQAQINNIVGNALSISVAQTLLSSLAIGGLLIAIAFVRPYPKTDADDLLHAPGGRWSRSLRSIFIVLGAMLIVAALAGYIGFAGFASRQIVITGTVLITGLLGFQASKAIAQERALIGTRLGDWLSTRFGFSEARVDQTGLGLGVLLGVTVFMTVLPSMAMLWGVDWLTVRSWFAWFFTGITIGSITISFTGIAAGILLFALGFWLTRRMQRLIDRNVLERGQVEIGARTSIRTAIGYVGIALAGLIGVSAAGLNLSNLALIAGALSLGIGFGLQNIVSNFVSGLILLAERPFKSGDIIEAGAITGVVKKVNVRATELELFDKKSVILPNSDLINAPVTNWMHKNTLARVEVPVGVAYGTDPQLVIDTLMEIVEDHPRVLSTPEPFVAFTDFGASSLDFMLYAYLADVSFGLGTRTELRLEIVKRFDVLGIEIPFPQRDVNLKIMDNVKEKGQEPPSPEEAVFDVIRTSKTPVTDED